MKKATILAAIALASMMVPMSQPANANPRQAAQTVLNYCSRNSQNYHQYQVCLNYGAMLIRKKYQYQNPRLNVQPQPPRRNYWDHNRREFHHCDNPIVPTSIC